MSTQASASEPAHRLPSEAEAKDPRAAATARRIHRQRQQLMFDEASAFLSRRPNALRVVLGAGLTEHHLALGIGPLWINADAADMIALRHVQLPRASSERSLDVPVDLHRPGWWRRLALPEGQREPALLLWCELWAERFDADTRQSLLRELATHAPPGTRLLMDLPARSASRCPIGPESALKSSPDTGLRSLTELTKAHPRLRLDAVRPVLPACGPWLSLLDVGFRMVTGLPWYAVYVIGVDA